MKNNKHNNIKYDRQRANNEKHNKKDIQRYGRWVLALDARRSAQRSARAPPACASTTAQLAAQLPSTCCDTCVVTVFGVAGYPKKNIIKDANKINTSRKKGKAAEAILTSTKRSAK